MLNQRQFQEAPVGSRLAAGQTLTLEEYKALQSEGKAPDTMGGDVPWYRPRHEEAAAGRAENRREAKEILGLNRNDPQYGSVAD